MGQGVQTYGAELDALTLQRILTHVFRTNLADEESTGARPTPVCIWGSHGIGKTSLIKEFAHRNGWKFRYCAPAQFEEMGDLHGLPVTHDPDPEVHGMKPRSICRQIGFPRQMKAALAFCCWMTSTVRMTGSSGA